MIRLHQLISFVLLALFLSACTDLKGPAKVSNPAERVEQSPESAEQHAAFQIQRARFLAIPVVNLPPSTIRGMALPLYNEFPSLSYEDMIRRAAAMGTTHLSLVVTWGQRTIRDNRIEVAKPETPDDARVIALIKFAQTLDMKVLLFPIVHVERRSEGEWRGKLNPTNPEAWKKDYRAFIYHYAELAQKAGAWGMSVGSELSSMEADTGFWLRLISQVREIFHGKLIYSANWDHYQKPEFWGELDFVGVSSYFEVAKSESEALHSVAARWQTHRADMLKFAYEQKRPLILTEIGYPAVESAAVKPWDYTSDAPPSSIAQMAGFASLVAAWSSPDERFGGLFVWHAWGFGGASDTSYAVREKPAEELLKRWFKK